MVLMAGRQPELPFREPRLLRFETNRRPCPAEMSVVGKRGLKLRVKLPFVVSLVDKFGFTRSDPYLVTSVCKFFHRYLLSALAGSAVTKRAS
jgi:hypothetical protein